MHYSIQVLQSDYEVKNFPDYVECENPEVHLRNEFLYANSIGYIAFDTISFKFILEN